jgi:hypothetical protein
VNVSMCASDSISPLFPYCRECDSRLPPSQFHPSALTSGRRSCKFHERERQKCIRTKRDLFSVLFKNISQVQRRRSGSFPGEDGPHLSASSIRDLWHKCGGLSVISGEKAETVVVINSNLSVSIDNIAPVTLHERRMLGRRVASPFPASAIARLRAQTNA